MRPEAEAPGHPPSVQLIIQDITERKEAENQLREERERLELALHGGDLGMWDWHIPSGSIEYNERWIEMLGYTIDELHPSFEMWSTLVHPDDLPQVRETLERHLRGETPTYESEYRLRHKHGHWVWVLDKGKVTERDERGDAIRVTGTHLDITDRVHTEQNLRRLAEAVEQSAEAVIITDADGSIVYVNPAFERITGYSRAEALGRNPSILQSGRHDEAFYKNLWDTITGGGHLVGHVHQPPQERHSLPGARRSTHTPAARVQPPPGEPAEAAEPEQVDRADDPPAAEDARRTHPRDRGQ
ncbi:MAG: putative diguanylate cyclase DgcE [Calditrichaeota bacterium]|nr:putative diguanylate cyclase DgcE [Calditrichota bacterium]